MRRLLPEPTAPVTIAEAYAAPLGTRPARPWVGLSMVASIDGSTVAGGDSAALSSEHDTAVLHRLRSLAEVIVVGAGTVRGEGYGPPRTPGQRIGVVTGSGEVDLSTALFRSGAGFLITTSDASFDVPAGIDVVRAGEGEVDLRRAMEQLPGSPGFVQAEGGAALNGALFDADLIDEINVTTSPRAVGGDGPRLATGAAEHDRRYELAQLVVDADGYVFARWRRATG